MRKQNGEVLFAWPLQAHTITAGWLYNDGSSHGAIDLRASVGTPVYAAEGGTVNWVQTWDGKTKTGNQSYGNLVRIQHAAYNGKKLETYYAHLSQVLVKQGDSVTEGQLIGYSGETGNCYGAHLHFEVRLNGIRYNPLNWLDGDFVKASAAVKLGDYTSVQPDPVAPIAPNGLYTITTSPMSAGDYCRMYDAVAEIVDKLGNIQMQGDGSTVTAGPMSSGDYVQVKDVMQQLANQLGNITVKEK